MYCYITLNLNNKLLLPLRMKYCFLTSKLVVLPGNTPLRISFWMFWIHCLYILCWISIWLPLYFYIHNIMCKNIAIPMITPPYLFQIISQENQIKIKHNNIFRVKIYLCQLLHWQLMYVYKFTNIMLFILWKF